MLTTSSSMRSASVSISAAAKVFWMCSTWKKVHIAASPEFQRLPAREPHFLCRNWTDCCLQCEPRRRNRQRCGSFARFPDLYLSECIHVAISTSPISGTETLCQRPVLHLPLLGAEHRPCVGLSTVRRNRCCC